MLVVSMSWLLKIVLLWTWGCRHRFKLVFGGFWDMLSELELLDHVVVLLLIFLRIIYYTVFHSGCTSLQCHKWCAGFSFFHIHTSICSLASYNICSHLIGRFLYCQSCVHFLPRAHNYNLGCCHQVTSKIAGVGGEPQEVSLNEYRL